MAHLRLIASLVGSSGVSGLASAGDLTLMQMSKTTSWDPFTVKSWVLALKSDATEAQVQHFCD